METEGREGEDESPDEEMKDVSEDRMRAKNRNGNIKTGMGTWKRVKETARELE